MSNTARRRIHAPEETFHGAGVELVEVIYWEHDNMSFWNIHNDDQTPLRAQAIACVERRRAITLSPAARTYLGDRTRFRLTVLDADTTLDDIANRPACGIHPVGADGWLPLDGHLTVHVFDYTPHHDSLYLRRMRNNCW